ncbi:hypothetical protein H9P43_004071 [Blastocladiella emersonii ATCC 22665]|nr:hypothetical protein H9P43_004071 [Blastocladiella emersonii ATCC 22665]
MSMQARSTGYGYPTASAPADYPSITSIKDSITAPVSRAANTLSAYTAPITDTVWSWSSVLLDTARVYWNGYPALRAFTYAFGALTAIPNLIFLTYAAISFGIVATIATVGVLVVEGGILGFGLLFLGPILFLSFWIALGGVALFTALFYGLRATSITLGTTQESFTGNTGIIGGGVGLAKNAAATTADLMEKAESFVVGREGLPPLVSGRV